MAKMYNRFYSQTFGRDRTPVLTDGKVQVTPSSEYRKGFDDAGVCITIRTGPPAGSNTKADQVMKIHLTLEEVKMITDMAAIVGGQLHKGVA